MGSDGASVASRVTKKSDGDSLSSGGVPLSEQTIAQALQTAKEQIQRHMRQ